MKIVTGSSGETENNYKVWLRAIYCFWDILFTDKYTNYFLKATFSNLGNLKIENLNSRNTFLTCKKKLEIVNNSMENKNEVGLS